MENNKIIKKAFISLFALLIIALPCFAEDNPFLIYRAYPNLEELTFSELADACVNYYGLDYLDFAKNEFTDLKDDKSNILRLVKLGVINGYDDGTVKPDEIAGELRANAVIGRIFKAIPNVEEKTGQFLFEDVKEEMTKPEYWISKNKDANKILLSKEEISEVNDAIYNTTGNFIARLENFKPTFNGNTLKEGLSGFNPLTYVYINNEKPTEKFWENVKKNILNARTKEEMDLKYGLAVNRALVKSLPIDAMLSDDTSDPQWDEIAVVSLNVNEPVVVYFQTADKKFYYVRTQVCDGYVKTEDIAICKNKAQWLKMWKPDDFLVVTGDKINLETNVIVPELSQKMLTMGTKLPLIKDYDGSNMVINRIPYNNYIVKIPTRDEKGYLKEEIVPVSAGKNVNSGYLDLTRANIIKTAFANLGNQYGWGGMLDSLDCAEFALRVYQCFGLTLPRNTTWQTLIQPNAVTSMAEKTSEEKFEMLKNLSSGAIIQFPGHEMIFLGEENGKLYTINSVSSLAQNGVKKRVRSIVVNSLDTKRVSGHTWFDDMNMIIEPYIK